MCLKFSRDFQGAALRLFVSHRGFPGEGPRRPKLAAADRPQVDLSRRLLSGEEVAGRAKMLAEFDSWLQTSGRGNLLAVLELDGKVVSRHLQTFGQNLYEQGRSHGDFVHAILAVSDEARDLRRSLQGAWDSAATWHALLPSSNHIPTPSIVACAMIALAMCWGWRSMATFVMLSFSGMLRPGETLRLRRRDLLFPGDLLSERRVLYVIITKPKMRRLAARREHVRIADSLVLDTLESWLFGAAPATPLFSCKAAELRRGHDQLVQFFGIASSDGVGLTPASHRAGGATHAFMESGGNVEHCRWQGRWASTSRTLEIYIQEVASLTVLPSLSATYRERVGLFASVAEELLRASSGRAA